MTSFPLFAHIFKGVSQWKNKELSSVHCFTGIPTMDNDKSPVYPNIKDGNTTYNSHNIL